MLQHDYLEGLKFADKYRSTGEQEFEMIVSKSYFSELERTEEIKSPNPYLPMAKLTALGWILRGAFGVSRQLIMPSAFGVHFRVIVTVSYTHLTLPTTPYV